MNLQKFFKITAVVLLMAIAVPATASNSNRPPTDNITDARAEQIMSRLKTIQSMDMATLSKREKKDLRKELNALKKESAGLNGKGVYLSIGAIIVVLLILILIL